MYHNNYVFHWNKNKPLWLMLYLNVVEFHQRRENETGNQFNQRRWQWYNFAFFAHLYIFLTNMKTGFLIFSVSELKHTILKYNFPTKKKLPLISILIQWIRIINKLYFFFFRFIRSSGKFLIVLVMPAYFHHEPDVFKRRYNVSNWL